MLVQVSKLACSLHNLFLPCFFNVYLLFNHSEALWLVAIRDFKCVSGLHLSIYTFKDFISWPLSIAKINIFHQQPKFYTDRYIIVLKTMPCHLVSKRSAGDLIQTNLTADMITKNPWLPLPKEGRNFRYPLRMILKATKIANTHETINVSDKKVHVSEKSGKSLLWRHALPDVSSLVGFNEFIF